MGSGGWIFNCPKASALPLYHSTRVDQEEARREILAKDGRTAEWLKPTAAEPAKAQAKQPVKKPPTIAELQLEVARLQREVDEEKAKLGLPSGNHPRPPSASTDLRFERIDHALAVHVPCVVESAHRQVFTTRPAGLSKEGFSSLSPQPQAHGQSDYDLRLKAKLDSMIADESNPRVENLPTKQVFSR